MAALPAGAARSSDLGDATLGGLKQSDRRQTVEDRAVVDRYFAT
jgi:hypothetical protein